MIDSELLISPWAISIRDEVPDGLRNWLESTWKAAPSSELRHLVIADIAYIERPPSISRNSTTREVEVDQQRITVTEETAGFIFELGGKGCFMRTDDALPCRIQCWGTLPHTPLYVALTEAFRRNGWMSMHCSAVIESGESGVTVFIGPSGAGKTYRLLERLRYGAVPIAEDRLWLRVDDGMVVPRDDYLRVLPDTKLAFSDLLQTPGRMDPDGKIRYLFSELGFSPNSGALIAQFVLLPPRNPAIRVDLPPVTLATLALWQTVGMPVSKRARDITQTFISRYSDHVTLL